MGDGGLKRSTITLLPSFNPPDRTVYHYCPPLCIFKVSFSFVRYLERSLIH